MFENYFGFIIIAAIFLIVSSLSAIGSQAQSQTNLPEKTKPVSATAIRYSSPQESKQLKTASPSKAEILTEKRKRELLRMIMGDLKVFNRLVDFELRRNPKLNFADAIQEAINCMRDDITRN